MKLTIIALYSAFLGCYDKPTFSEYPEDMTAEMYHRQIMSVPDEAYKARAHEKTVCILGTFDDVTGSMELLEQPKKLLELSTCFPRGYLASKEAKK